MRCGNNPAAPPAGEDAEIAAWFGAWLTWMGVDPHDRGPVPPAPDGASLEGMIGYLRPWTPPEKTETGQRFTVKRACNGCGVLLGDVTTDEIERAIAGLPIEDVRRECPACQRDVGCCAYHDHDPEIMPRCAPDSLGGYCCDNCPTLRLLSSATPRNED